MLNLEIFLKFKGKPQNSSFLYWILFAGCPDGWIAGPTGCYQVLPNIVTKQEFAVNKCLARGGHLVTIETDLENHFISNAFWNFTHGIK